MYKDFRNIIVVGAVVCCLCMNVAAVAGTKAIISENGAKIEVNSTLRASGSFNVSVNPYARAKGDKDLPMEVGETVRIYATYSPDSASMDFGLVDPDGVFHYVSANNGNVDTTFEIPERGNYRLGIKNNSGNTVQVSGFVKY